MEVGDPTCGQAVFPIYGVLGTHRMRVSNGWGGCTVPAADGTCVEEAAAAGRRFVVCSRGNQREREAASRNRG